MPVPQQESVIEEITRKIKHMATGDPPLFTTPTPYSNPIPTGHTIDDARRIMLLAAAEESYSQAASVLKPALVVLANSPGQVLPMREQIETGLHLLKESMAAHNRYMKSIK